MGKPGYKTTEFWLTVAANAFGALQASGALGDGSFWSQALGFGVMALSNMGYAAGRSWSKVNDGRDQTAKEIAKGVKAPDPS